MPTCNNIVLRLPDGTLVNGENTIVDDLANLMSIDANKANEYVDNIVNLNNNTPGSFGAWFQSQTLSGSNFNPLLDEQGIVTAQAVYQYIKDQEIRQNNDAVSIRFPDVVLTENEARPILETFTVGVFNRLFALQNKDINQIIYDLSNGLELDNQMLISESKHIISRLNKRITKLEFDGKMQLANDMRKVITNLSTNFDHFKLSFYQYLNTLNIESDITITEPTVDSSNIDEETTLGEVVDNEVVDSFEDADDTIIDEEAEISRDSAQYNQKLEVNQRTSARTAVYLFAHTLPTHKVELKDDVEAKEKYTKDDYKKPRVTYNPNTYMYKVADGKRVMKLLHNVLGNDIPSLDVIIEKLNTQIEKFYSSPDTAADAKLLGILRDRLNAYQNTEQVADTITQLKENLPKSFIANKTAENLLLRVLSRTEIVQQFTKMINNFYHSVMDFASNSTYLVNNNKALLGINASDRIQNQLNNFLNRRGLDKTFEYYTNLVDTEFKNPVEKLKDFLNYAEITIPNIDYFLTVDLDGNPINTEAQSALSVIASKMFSPNFITDKSQLFKTFKYTGNSKYIASNMRKFLLLVAQNSYYDFELGITDYEGKKLNSVGLYHHIGLTAAYINNRLANKLNPNLSASQRQAQLRNLSTGLAEELVNIAAFQEEAPSFYLTEIMENGGNLSVNIDVGMTQTGVSGQKKKTPTKKLTTRDRFVQTTSLVTKGATPLIQAADRPVHMSVGITNESNDLINTFDDDLGSIKDKFINALRYELLVSKQYYEENVGKDLKHFDKHMSDFRLFQGLTEELGMTMEQLIEMPLAPIDPSTESNVFANNQRVNDKIDKFIDKKINEWSADYVTYLKSEKAIDPNDPMLKAPKEFAGTDQEYLQVLVSNQILGQFEQVRLFFGDLAVFKDSNEMFKRVATANSTKQIQRVDAEINSVIDLTLDMDSFENTSISRNMNETQDQDAYEQYLQIVEQQIVEGNHVTVVFNDPVTSASKDNVQLTESLEKTFNTYLTKLGVPNAEQQSKEWAKSYDNNEHADSAGIISMDAYRRILLRTDQWTPEKENLYTKLREGKPITKQDIRKARITPLKLQYSGYYKSAQHKNNGFYANRKFAAFPAIPGLLDANSAMEEVIETMQAHRIEFGFFSSSAKVIHGPAYDFYNFKNEFEDKVYNPEIDNETIVDTLPAQFMGIQQNVNEQDKGKVTSSIQLAKNTITNLYENGELVVPELRDSVNTYENASEEVVRREADKLMGELAIPELQKYSDFFQQDFNKLLDLISNAAKDRGYTRDVLNVIDRMRSSEEDIFGLRPVAYLEQLPISDSVQYLLTAIFRNRVISKKRKGEGYVQAPAVGTEINKEAVNIEDSLNQRYQFYRLGSDGTTWLPMQIAEPLPMDLMNYVANTYGDGKFTTEALDAFNEAIAKDEQQFIQSNGKTRTNLTNIRRRIGYRIPHQAASSTEVIHVTKFLHPVVNTQVIVPKELIKKNGSDYDVDKMNVYKPFYSVNKTESGNLDITYSTENVDQLYEKYKERTVFLGQDVLSKERFVKDNLMYEYMNTSTLFNQLLEAEMDIAIHPSNVAQMFIPLNENSLTNDKKTGIADRILKLKGITTDPVTFSNALSPTTQLKKFKVFNGVKSNVGIAAVNIGYFPLFQRGNYVYKDNSNGLINLLVENTINPLKEHNLSSRLTQNGQLKTDVASQYANAYLDSAAKTGYPQLVNMTGKNSGILMLALHMGADPYRTLLILNQPVVTEFMKNKQNQQSVTRDARVSNNQLFINSIGPYLTGANAAEKYLKDPVPKNTVLTNKMLEKGIKDPLSPEGKQVQQIVLKLYSELLEANTEMFNFGQSNSADRSNFKEMETFRNTVIAEGKKSSRVYAKADTKDIGFLRKLKESKSEYYKNISALFMHNHPDLQYIVNKTKEIISDTTLKFDRKKLNRVLNSVNKQVFMFGISNVVLGERGFNYVKEADKVMKGNSSVAKRLFNIQNNPDHPLYDTPLINALLLKINYENKGYDVVQPDLSNVSARERQDIIQQHADMFNGSIEEQALATDLIKLSIVQTGHETSAYALHSILNQEAIFNFLNPYSEQLVAALRTGDTMFKNLFEISFVSEYLYTFHPKYSFDKKVLEAISLPNVGNNPRFGYDSNLKKSIIQGGYYSDKYVLPSDYFVLQYGADLTKIEKDPVVDKIKGTKTSTTETNAINESVMDEFVKDCLNT